MTPAFKDWCAQLRVEMLRLSPKQPARVSVIIDCMIPYLLGWTPDRAARAILCVDYKDYRKLAELGMEKEDTNAAPVEAEDGKQPAGPAVGAEPVTLEEGGAEDLDGRRHDMEGGG